MMRRVRHTGTRQLGALFLLALLACPLALSGHRHRADDLGANRASCTICAATAHVPALSQPAVPQFILLARGETPERLALLPPALGECRTHGPRAPPTASSTLIA